MTKQNEAQVVLDQRVIKEVKPVLVHAIKEACKHFIKTSLVQTTEVILRGLFLLVPVGVHYWLLQTRDKPKQTLDIGNHLTSTSVWTYVAPGVILICKNGVEYKAFRYNLGKWYNVNRTKMFTLTRYITYVTVMLYCIISIIKRV